MEKIAFIIGETFIYWSSILLTLATITAICMFAFFYLKNSRNAIAWAIFVLHPLWCLCIFPGSSIGTALLTATAPWRVPWVTSPVAASP